MFLLNQRKDWKRKKFDQSFRTCTSFSTFNPQSHFDLLGSDYFGIPFPFV